MRARLTTPGRRRELDPARSRVLPQPGGLSESSRRSELAETSGKRFQTFISVWKPHSTSEIQPLIDADVIGDGIPNTWFSLDLIFPISVD